MANRKELQGSRTKGVSKIIKANKRTEAEIRDEIYREKQAEESPLTME